MKGKQGKLLKKKYICEIRTNVRIVFTALRFFNRKFCATVEQESCSVAFLIEKLLAKFIPLCILLRKTDIYYAVAYCFNGFDSPPLFR